MAVSKKNKRLLCLKANFPSDTEKKLNLERLLREVYELLPNVNDRRVEFKEKTWWGSFYKPTDSSFGFQISAATPGEAATLVPTGNLAVPSVNLDQKSAPEGFEFSDGDIICCVSNNDLFVCCSQVLFTSIEFFLRALFKHAEFNEDICSVEIDKPANLNKLAIIRRYGVKRIILNTSLGAAEFSRLADIQGVSLLRKIWRGLAREDKRLAQTASEANGRFKIELSGGGKAQPWLNSEAESVIEESASYCIVTGDGTMITDKEITLSKKARMEPFGKSVFLEEALNKLEVFKDEILNPKA